MTVEHVWGYGPDTVLLDSQPMAKQTIRAKRQHTRNVGAPEHSEVMHTPTATLAPKAPDSYHNFRWILWMLRKSPFEFILFGVALILVGLVAPSACRASSRWVEDTFFNSVALKVISFDYTTGETRLAFDNTLHACVPVSSLYLTVESISNSPPRPLPSSLHDRVTIFDKGYILVPYGAAVEVGTKTRTSAHSAEQRVVRLASPFLPVNAALVLLPTSTLVTNVFPRHGSFARICDQLSDGTSLTVTLHVTVTDTAGRSRSKSICLGDYSRDSTKRGMATFDAGTDIDIYREARVADRSHAGNWTFATPNGLELTADFLDKYAVPSLLVNESSGDELFTFGPALSGPVIVALSCKRAFLVSYAASAAVASNECLQTDFSIPAVSQDSGSNVLSLFSVFSSAVVSASSQIEPGKLFTLSLPSTNWCFLVNGGRWVHVSNFTLSGMAIDATVFRPFPKRQVTSSMLHSNYLSFVRGELHPDAGWSVVTNKDALIQSSTGILISSLSCIPIDTNGSCFNSVIR